MKEIKLTEEFKTKIMALSEEHLHGEALIEIAKYFGKKVFIDIFTKIDELRIVDKYICFELAQYRLVKRKDFLKWIRKNYGKRVFDEILALM